MKKLNEVLTNIVLGVLCTAGISLNVFGQTGQNEFSIALDARDFDFIASGFSPSNKDSTKGGSSLRAVLSNDNEFFVRANIPVRDITIFWDYKILSGTEILQQRVTGVGQTNHTFESISTAQDEGWHTAKAYLRPQITSFQLTFDTFDPSDGILIDNLRWARGDREFLTQGNREPKTCNPDNPASNNMLSRALDNTFFNFFTLGKEFRAQNLISKFGGDAVQNNPLTGVGDSAGIGTGIQSGAPFLLTWDWKVSSHFNNAGFEFILFDENSIATNTRISLKGEKDWRQASVTVPRGIHFPVWFYSRAASGGPYSGLDTGWLDRVRISHLADKPCVNLTPIYPLILD